MIGHTLVLKLLRKLVAERRLPDVVIGGEQSPYLRRWWVIPRNRHFNVYLHHFLRSDDDRALHDHPWWNISWLLSGDYAEVVPVNPAEPAGASRSIQRSSGDVAFRKAEAAHRIELWPEMAGGEKPVWTLFITGPNVRDWGFWCPKGWKHWKDFTAFKTKGDSNTVGPGCGEP